MEQLFLVTIIDEMSWKLINRPSSYLFDSQIPYFVSKDNAVKTYLCMTYIFDIFDMTLKTLTKY